MRLNSKILFKSIALLCATLVFLVLRAETNNSGFTVEQLRQKCTFPVFNENEEVSASISGDSFHLAFQFEGDGFYGRTAYREKTKSLNGRSTLEDKLINLEKDYEKNHFDLYDDIDSFKKFITIEGTTFRLYIANTGFDGKKTQTIGRLFTVERDEIVFFQITRFNLYSQRDMEADLIKFRNKCS